MTEESLWIRRARQGDADAFEQLLLRYEKKTYHLALRLSGTPEDAEEITQEAFLAAWKGLPSFREEASFATWLYRLTVNAANDFFRRRKTPGTVVALDDVDNLLEIPDRRYLPEDEVQRSELREDVQKALQELSPEHRSVLLLRELQQLQYEEIARVLQLDLGTVKSRLYRARNQLREILTARGTFWGEAPSKKAKSRM